jgi:hypothetical protein
VTSVATESFWSRAPYAVGSYAVKFKFEPLAAPADGSEPKGDDVLRMDIVERLRRDDVGYRLRAIHYQDETLTPIEDGTVPWPEDDAPPEILAEVVLPRQDLTSGDGPEGERRLDALRFTPWNTTEGVRPIGGLNRARRPVYEASGRHRSPEA